MWSFRGLDWLGDPLPQNLQFQTSVRLAVKEADLFIEKVRQATGWPF